MEGSLAIKNHALETTLRLIDTSQRWEVGTEPIDFESS